jgi:uncharacterized membrane protein
MNRAASFVTTTITGGFFVVLPIVLVVFLIVEAMGMLLALLEPIAQRLPGHGLIGLGIPQLLALFIIVGACFVTGLVISTRVGTRARERLEDIVLQRLPAYGILKSLTQQFAGTAQGGEFAPALARIHGPGAWSLCFIVEEHDGGAYTVFVPTSPTPTVGFVYRVERDGVRRLDASMGAAVNCAMRWGIGLRNLLPAGSGPRT